MRTFKDLSFFNFDYFLSLLLIFDEFSTIATTISVESLETITANMFLLTSVKLLDDVQSFFSELLFSALEN